MTAQLQRAGVWPSIFIGFLMVAVGILTLNWLVNNVWPVDPILDVAQFEAIQRLASDGRLDVTTLLRYQHGEAVSAALASIVVAFAGVSLPLIYLINRRMRTALNQWDHDAFQVEHRATGFLVLLRQAVLFGLWVAFCTWLQMNRVLGFPVALLAGLVLMLFEALLLVRNRGHEREDE